MQNKLQEKKFFDSFSSAGDYDVFTPYGYRSIIKKYLKLIRTAVTSEYRVIDLGCGTGAFTRKFNEHFDNKPGFFGLDISVNSIILAEQLAPNIHFCVGDIEQCCFKDESFDIVLFSGVLHHFGNFEKCLNEGYRILKYGGCLLSYDPNIKNPSMWLYRHPSSPLFSTKGKTSNERLLSSQEISLALESAGFSNVAAPCISGVTFKYLASKIGRFLLPVYNFLEFLLGISPWAGKYGSFVIGYGEKQKKAMR